MKLNKYIPLPDYSNFISPILPKFDALDGLGSLFNLTGTYYDFASPLDAITRASEQMTKISDVWKDVGSSLTEATDQFAAWNKIGTFNHYRLPQLPETPWKHLPNPKKQ